MQLKRRERGFWSRALAGRKARLACGAGVGVALLATGFWLRGTPVADWARGVVDDVVAVPRAIEGMLSQPVEFALDVKHEHVMKLSATRDEAMRVGYLPPGRGDFVPATLRVGDRSVRVRLRLQADLGAQLEGVKWPFRVHVRGDATVLGMKRFSLRRPETHGYLAEWVFQRALAREDVLALRYEFVAVTLNGKDLGVYALEENVAKRLVEHGRRREGPIVRFDDSWLSPGWRAEAVESPEGAYGASVVDAATGSSQVMTTAEREQLAHASSQLERFRDGELAAGDVFDVDRMARYCALVDLLGAERGARWHHARYYFNPVTARLEPIGSAAGAGRATDAPLAAREGVWIGHGRPRPGAGYYAQLFADSELYTAYLRELRRVTTADYLAELVAALDEELARHLAVLRSDVPAYEFDWAVIERNRAALRMAVSPAAPLHALASVRDDGAVLLELGAVQPFPVDVVSVLHRGVPLTARRSADSVGDGVMALVPGRRPAAVPTYRDMVLDPPPGQPISAADAAALVVRCRLTGSDDVRDVTARAGSRPSLWFDAGVPAASNPEGLPFLSVDAARRRVSVRPGRWRVEGDVSLPEGFSLVCGPGTTLDLIDGAVLVARGPVELIGTEQDPIVVESSDGKGQGLVVLGATARSTPGRGCGASLFPRWRDPRRARTAALPRSGNRGATRPRARSRGGLPGRLHLLDDARRHGTAAADLDPPRVILRHGVGPGEGGVSQHDVQAVLRQGCFDVAPHSTHVRRPSPHISSQPAASRSSTLPRRQASR